MVVDYYSTVLLTYQNSSIRQYIDIAPTTQYREYKGGSVYEENGTEYLKVIGEDGYTGELETVENSKGEDVPVTGMMYAAEEPNSSALCIPTNSDPEKYEAAFKFISWAAGPEGQARRLARSQPDRSRHERRLPEYGGQPRRQRIRRFACQHAYLCGRLVLL